MSAYLPDHVCGAMGCTTDSTDDLEDVDDRVLQVVREDRSSEDNTRIVLNLEAGDLPEMVLGHEIETGQETAFAAAGGD